MSEQKRRALLGRIAELGWFTQRGEPVATLSLAMLLEDELLKDALLGFLQTCTQTDLRSIAVFVPEVIHEDRSRPDLEGQDEDQRPVLVVEAKFGAVLSPAQVLSYLTHQRQRLGAGRRGAFVLLVPPNRAIYADQVLNTALEDWRLQGYDPATVGSAVVTWEDWIGVWDEAVHDLPDASALSGDLVQFRAMCLTLGGLVIAPLGEAAWGRAWRDRQEDLRQIVHEVTSSFIRPGDRFPMGDEIGYEHRRYIPGGDAAPAVACSVGVGTRFADEGATPFWLRYHRNTPGFPIVKRRLTASRFQGDIRYDDRNLWLPLAAPADVAGPELVESLTAQVKEIIATVSATRRTEPRRLPGDRSP